MIRFRYFSWRELRVVLSMSLPAVSVYIGIMVMQLCTMYFAGRIGLRELGVFGLANGFFNLCFLFCIGLNVAGGVVCGESYGRRDDKAVTEVGVQSIWVAFWAGVLCMSVAPIVPWLLIVSGQDPSLVDEVLETTVIVLLALPFISVFATVRSFLTSITHPYILLKIIPPVVLLNLVLLFVFVDVLKMGLMGLAYGFVINNLILCLWSIVVCYTNPYSGTYKIFHPKNIFRVNWQIISRLLKIGIPSGLTTLTESATFQLLLFMGGALGMVSLNSLQIGIQVNALCLMISVGVGQVTMARISNAVGAREYHKVALISGSSIAAVAFTVAVFAVLILLFKDQIALAFLSRGQHALLGETLQTTIYVLTLTALAQIVDSGQTICAYCLRGIRDTREFPCT